MLSRLVNLWTLAVLALVCVFGGAAWLLLARPHAVVSVPSGPVESVTLPRGFHVRRVKQDNGGLIIAADRGRESLTFLIPEPGAPLLSAMDAAAVPPAPYRELEVNGTLFRLHIGPGFTAVAPDVYLVIIGERMSDQARALEVLRGITLRPAAGVTKATPARETVPVH